MLLVVLPQRQLATFPKTLSLHTCKVIGVQLSQPLIINAGLSMLNEFGLGDVTMRRIAKHLNVAPGALYWHFTNKQALVAGMAEYILYPLLHPLALRQPEDWQSGAESFAKDFREVLLQYRDGAELVSAGFSNPELRQQVEIGTQEAMGKNVELSQAQCWLLASTLIDYTIGAVLNQQTLENAAANAQSGAPQMNGHGNPEAHRIDTSVAPEILDSKPMSHDDAFAAGIKLIIQGLAAEQ